MSASKVSTGASALLWSGVVLVFAALIFVMKSKPPASVVGAQVRLGALLGQGEPLPRAAPMETPVGLPARPRPAASLPARTESAPAPPIATTPEPLYDPFARHGTEDPPARVLVAVADMQLGVLTSAKVRDEARLVELLTRLGGELERLSAPPGSAEGAARQQLLESYQKELGRYVDGEVELRGRDFILGLEVGEVRPPPLPTEPDWRPRPD